VKPIELTPDVLLRAYAAGVFPMAESRGDRDVFWVDPEWRGIIPLDGFHVPKRLRRTVRQGPFEVRCDTAFADVMRGCAAATSDRPDTWISDAILRAYTELHKLGFAHSVECWRDGALVGGLYGVSLAGAFFGESMFTRETGASKVALVHLVARLTIGGFKLLDTQFITEHLTQFGAVEVTRARYHDMLNEALDTEVRFPKELSTRAMDAYLQSLTQIS
jgi:leucyl/phenylalanyl-tRNA--protein transferase